jgi:hypothetical protein
MAKIGKTHPAVSRQAREGRSTLGPSRATAGTSFDEVRRAPALPRAAAGYRRAAWRQKLWLTPAL